MKQDIEFAVPLFKAGAEWRINSVWHDAREKPDKGKNFQKRIIICAGHMLKI